MKNVPKTQIIIINENPYRVNFASKRGRNVTVRINNRLDIFVNKPPSVSEKQAMAFLSEHSAWIRKVINKQQAVLEEMSAKEIWAHKMLWLLGKLYVLAESRDLITEYAIQENKIFFKNDYSSLMKELEQEGLAVIEKAFSQWLSEFPVLLPKTPTLCFRTMKSRWGSCNRRTGKITLNKKLIHVSLKLIDYVIVHELTHFQEPNHGVNFHAQIERIFPNHRAFEREIKKFAFLLTEKPEIS
jgi:hypothetical protein